MFAENDKVWNNIRALTDSDVLIAQATNDGFALKQFYKIDEHSNEIHYENYGSWSSQSGIVDERSTKIISRRRENLRGKVITSSYVALNKDSRNHLSDFVNKNTDTILKLNYIIVNTMLDKLNCTKKELFQSTWGYYNPKSKKWSGMVGDVVHKGADIGGETKTNARWARPRWLMRKRFLCQGRLSSSMPIDFRSWNTRHSALRLADGSRSVRRSFRPVSNLPKGLLDSYCMIMERVGRKLSWALRECLHIISRKDRKYFWRISMNFEILKNKYLHFFAARWKK